MKEKILSLLTENARMSNTEIARRCGISEPEINDAIAELEHSGVIRGYTAILNDAAIRDDRRVRALIEVKVTPRRDGGFDRVAQRIAKFPEVTDLVLVSGNYDLLLIVEGDSLQEVANFVAEKLATIDGVLSCSTGFQLRRYKNAGRIMQSDEEYDRLKVCF